MAGGVPSPCRTGALNHAVEELRRICRPRRTGARPHVRRPDPWSAHGALRRATAGPGRPRGQRSQTPGNLRGNRPLRHRRHPGGHRLPAWEARAQVPGLRQSRSHVLRRAAGPGGARRRARKRQAPRPRNVSRDGRQKRPADARLSRDARPGVIRDAVGSGASGPEEFPGYKGERTVCTLCGEGINFKREVVREGQVLCKACAGERYYEPL